MSNYYLTYSPIIPYYKHAASIPLEKRECGWLVGKLGCCSFSFSVEWLLHIAYKNLVTLTLDGASSVKTEAGRIDKETAAYCKMVAGKLNMNLGGCSKNWIRCPLARHAVSPKRSGTAVYLTADDWPGFWGQTATLVYSSQNESLHVAWVERESRRRRPFDESTPPPEALFWSWNEIINWYHKLFLRTFHVREKRNSAQVELAVLTLPPAAPTPRAQGRAGGGCPDAAGHRETRAVSPCTPVIAGFN